MKHNLTELKQLDDVLIYVSSVAAKSSTFKKLSVKYCVEERKFESLELIEILEKLTEDHYLRERLLPNPEEIKDFSPVYTITFKGKMFINNGGYVKEKFNKTIKNLATFLNAFVLCVAAIVAIVYSVQEIISKMQGKVCP